MPELLTMLGFFAFASLAAYALSLYVNAKPKKKAAASLMPGQAVRIRTSDGLYRARFQRSQEDALVFGAPIQRDRYVPIRIGEKVLVEAPTATGVYSFRSTVTHRDIDSHEILLAVPETMSFEDRRQQRRTRGAQRQVLVEADEAWLADIAEQGVCVTMDRAVRQGERIRVDVDGKEPAFAWVLDCEPNTGPGKGKHRVRARFEEENALHVPST